MVISACAVAETALASTPPLALLRRAARLGVWGEPRHGALGAPLRMCGSARLVVEGEPSTRRV